MHSYKRNFDQDHSMELSQQIEDQHDLFLETDDPEKKAEHLRLMRGYMNQYLYLVPHQKKFYFKETIRVLANSVAAIEDFDPREASIAFENLARYSHNLIEQPWRKEFHKIKVTSGFYIHNIRAHIANAHELLSLLNYTGADDTTLMLISVPDIKRLKAFSKECFIACQECVILSQIWERFQQKFPDYPFTVVEALRARSELTGDLETILKRLQYDVNTQMHEENIRKQHELAARQREERELELQRQQHVFREMERQENELREQKLREEKSRKDLQKRTMLEEQARKAQQDLERHRLEQYKRKHVPTDRLIDYEESNDDYIVPEEEEVVQQVLKNTEKFSSNRTSSQHMTDYQNQYSDKKKSSSSSMTHTQNHHLTNGTGTTALKEIGEVAFDMYLNPSKQHDFDEPDVRDVDKILRDYEEKASRVEELRNKRSSTTAGSTLHQHQVSPSYKTDGIVSLMNHSPPTSSTSTSAFATYSRMNRNDVTPTEAAERERDEKTPLALLKSKVPVETVQNVYPDFEASASTTTSPFEVGTDLLMATNATFNYTSNMNNQDTKTNEKNVVDKDLGFPKGGKKKSSEKWSCHACTYDNKGHDKICQMCGKSRDFVLKESSSSSASDSGESIKSYASATRSYQLRSRSDAVKETLIETGTGESERKISPTPPMESMDSYPPLLPPVTSNLSAEKFRNGLFPESKVTDENFNHDSVPSTSDKKWRCTLCTLYNPPNKRLCSACNAPKSC